MQTIRYAVIATAIAAASAAAAQAQTREPRITLSGLVQQEIVRVDGGEGTFTAIGAGVDLRLTRHISLHGELTAGSGEANHSQQGIFWSIAPPNSSREEIERLGVHMQRASTWKAGHGGAILASFHTAPSQQVGVIVTTGISFREVAYTAVTTVVKLPPGWDPSRSTGAGTESLTRTRGGPVLGIAVPVRVGSRFVIAPEARYQFSVGDEEYKTGTLGMRASWGF